MKKTSSLVWRFFDRLEENKRCVAVLCKLCDTQYKYFGNTTNLRTHLVNKHPIQWDLLQNGSLDESTFRAFDDEENTNQTTISSAISSRPKRRRIVKSYKNDNVRYSVSVDLNKQKETGKESMPVIEIQRVDVLENSDIDGDQHCDDNDLSHQLQDGRGSDEEWLEDDIYQTVDSYEPKRKKIKHRQIKREITTPPPRRQSNYLIQQPRTYPRTERILIDNTQRKDEYSVFGEYVANKLRRFKGQQTRGNVQQLITTILWQAEYGLYDNMESVKRVLLHSVQDMEVEQPIQEQEAHTEIQTLEVIDEQKDKNSVIQHVTIVDAASE